MRTDEFEAFKGELKQLCSTLGKAYTDALGQAYWRSLRDVELDEIQAHVERILLNATGETKFPKPAALRSMPRSGPVRRSDDPVFREAEKRSVINSEELRKKDFAEWKRRMGDRPCVRFVEQYGSENVFFDVDEWCWRRISA